MSDKIKETFFAEYSREDYALGALEFVCNEKDRLEAENKELKDRISQAEKMVDVRKLVKPLQWEIENVYNNFCIEDTDFFAKCGDFLFTITHVRNDCSISCETKEIKYFQDSIIVNVKYESCVKLITQIYIENSVQSNIIDLNKAKQAAQDWLVSLVANACGSEAGK